MRDSDVMRDLVNEIRSLRTGAGSAPVLEALLAGRASAAAEAMAAVREAASLEYAIFEVGARLWSEDGQELLALEIFREAARRGSREAEAALGDALVWMGAYEDAITVLQSSRASRKGDQAKVSGLLGKSLFALGDQSAAVEELLREGAAEYEEFGLDHAMILLHRGSQGEAVTILRALTESGVFGSALLLGNILDDDLDDSEGAQTAYMKGIQSGDAHSAYNLAVLHYRHDRVAEARHYLAVARRMGDLSEFPDLDP